MIVLIFSNLSYHYYYYFAYSLKMVVLKTKQKKNKKKKTRIQNDENALKAKLGQIIFFRRCKSLVRTTSLTGFVCRFIVQTFMKNV